MKLWIWLLLAATLWAFIAWVITGSLTWLIIFFGSVLMARVEMLAYDRRQVVVVLRDRTDR